MPQHISAARQRNSRRKTDRKPIAINTKFCAHVEPRIVESSDLPNDTPTTPFDLDNLPHQCFYSAVSADKSGLGTAYPSSEALPLLDEERRPRTPVNAHDRRNSFSHIGLWRDGVIHGEPQQDSTEVPIEPERELVSVTSADAPHLELLTPAVYSPAAKPNLSVVIPPARRRPVEATPNALSAISRSILSRYNPSAAPSLKSASTPPVPSLPALEGLPLPLVRFDSPHSAIFGSSASLAPGSPSTPSLARPATAQSKLSRPSSASSRIMPSDTPDDASYYCSKSSITSVDSVDPGRRDMGEPRTANHGRKDAANLNKALPASPGPDVTAFQLSANSRSARTPPLDHNVDDVSSSQSAGLPSPTFTEAMLELQSRLGHISPSDRDQSVHSRMTGLSPLSPSTQASGVHETDVERIQEPLPAIRSLLTRCSTSAEDSTDVQKRYSASDIADASPIAVSGPSLRRLHSTSASRPTYTSHLSTTRSELEDDKLERSPSLSAHTPRMPETNARATKAQSARLSILEPAIVVDDGLIVVDNDASSGRHKKLAKSSPRATEAVLLRIMASLPTFTDLLKTSSINTGMRRVYKQNEIILQKAVLKNKSLAAWELREWCDTSRNESPVSITMSKEEESTVSYIADMIRDASVLDELKAMVLGQCRTYLRKTTVQALQRRDCEPNHIDDSLYRIWCFCKIFGGGRGRDDDLAGQVDWFKGGVLANSNSCEATIGAGMDFDMSSVLLNPPEHFAVCNAGGLDADQLLDMNEMWNCLGALLQNYHAASKQARKYGIFDRANVKNANAEKEAGVLEEWLSYIMSLGPSAILEMARRADNIDDGFAYAVSEGYINWSMPAYNSTRNTFFKEPVSRLYEERIHAQSVQTRNSTPDTVQREVQKRRVAGLAQEIRMARCKSNFQRLPMIDMSAERPWSVMSRSTMSSSESMTPMRKQFSVDHELRRTNTTTIDERRSKQFSVWSPTMTTTIEEDRVSSFDAWDDDPKPARPAQTNRPRLQKSYTDNAPSKAPKKGLFGFTVSQAREALRLSDASGTWDAGHLDTSRPRRFSSRKSNTQAGI